MEGETPMMMLMALLTSLQARLEERERGQGMVEYGLIIAAVAIAVIVALFALGPKIGSMFSSTAASLKEAVLRYRVWAAGPPHRGCRDELRRGYSAEPPTRKPPWRSVALRGAFPR